MATHAVRNVPKLPALRTPPVPISSQPHAKIQTGGVPLYLAKSKANPLRDRQR